MLTEVTPEAHKILKRWTKAQYYVYIRPLSSLFLEPEKKHKIYWRVQVEFRTVNWQVWGDEGYDLSEIIERLDLRVPRRDTKNLDYKPKAWNGLNAPEAIREAERKKAAKKNKGKKKVKSAKR